MSKKVYSKILNRNETPQNEPIPGSDQVRNNAGGYAWGVDSLKRLRRFLIIGSEGGTYYVNERKLTLDNAKTVLECLRLNYRKTVDEIVQVSTQGLAPKNDPAIFSLAIAAAFADKDNPGFQREVRRYALDRLPLVCRIGTDLFHFAEYVTHMRGVGRGLRTAIAKWYTDKDANELAYQLVKYQQRDGWGHSDLLLLSHPIPKTPEQHAAMGWSTGRVVPGENDTFVRMNWDAETKVWGNPQPEPNVPFIIHHFESAKKIKTPQEMANFIRGTKLSREMIPSEFLPSREVQEAMFPNLGMTALLRNLGNMGRSGLISRQNLSWVVDVLIPRLSDKEAIRKSRIHPIAALIALRAYSAGTNRRDETWEVVPQVVTTLDEMFYLAFHNVEPTNLIHYLALDLSSSMGDPQMPQAGNMTPTEIEAALAMVVARTEPKYIIKGFSTQLIPLNITAKSTLKQATREARNNNFGGTDCSAPILDATLNKIPVDVFVVYTDNETWAGRIHPSQALHQYRTSMKRDAKMIVVGMTATEISIADPNDTGMLDVVGFDASLPELMRSFAQG